MSDTANFDTNEKVNFLFKKDMGFSSTNENLPWFQETNVIVNDYFLSKNLLVSEIPVTPNFNITPNITDVYLNETDFTTTSNDFGVKEDSTRNVRKYTKLILDAVPNSSNNSYYKLDNYGNNVLADALQFNTNWDLVSPKPYGYILTNQSKIAISPDSPDEILQDSTGGNWIFDIKNGIIFFPDYNSSLVDNTSNKPVLTFYKYIGQKGGKFENNSDNSFNNVDISGILKLKGIKNTITESSKALYYQPSSGEVTYHEIPNGNGSSQSGNFLKNGDDASFNNIDVSSNINISGTILINGVFTHSKYSFDNSGNLITSGDISSNQITTNTLRATNIELSLNALAETSNNHFHLINELSNSLVKTDLSLAILTNQITNSNNNNSNSGVGSNNGDGIINNAGQTYFELVTTQPNKFSFETNYDGIPTSGNASAITINWNYDDIIPKTNNVYNVINNIASVKQRQLPFINKIKFEISGTGLQDEKTEWIELSNIIIPDDLSYNQNEFKVYNFVKYTQNPTTHVNSILSKIQDFDIRIYGENYANNIPTIDNRALYFYNLSFKLAEPPSQPVFLSANYNNHNTIIADFSVVYIENNELQTQGKLKTAETSYNLVETLRSVMYNSLVHDDNIIETLNTNNTQFSVTLNNLFSGSIYNITTKVKNDLNDASFSISSETTTSEYTLLPNSRGIGTTINSNIAGNYKYITTSSNTTNLTNQNKIYINLGNNDTLTYVNSNNQVIELTKPYTINQKNETVGFGKFIDNSTSLINLKVSVNDILKQTLSFDGCFNTIPANDNFSNSNLFSFVKGGNIEDIYTDNKDKGFRLKSNITFYSIITANITNSIGDASTNPYRLKYEYIRDSNVGGSNSTNTYNIYVDNYSETPLISNNNNSGTVISVQYNMGIPSVDKFFLNMTRTYSSINSQYMYINGNNLISNIGSITNTSATSSKNLMLTNEEIVSDGIYSFTNTKMNNKTSNYYTNLHYTSNRLTKNNSISWNETIYNIYTSNLQILSLTINHYCDYNSFNKSSGSIDTAKLVLSNRIFWEIDNIDNLISNMGGLNFSQYTNHQNPIKDSTLLFIDGNFRTNASLNYPNVNDFSYNGVTISNFYSFGTTTYDLSGITDGNNGYKWIGFKFSMASDTSIHNFGGSQYNYLNIYQLLTASPINLSSNILFQLRLDGGDGEANNNQVIGFIQQQYSGSNRIGRLDRPFKSTELWYNQPSDESYYTIFQGQNRANYGSYYREDDNNWGPLLDINNGNDDIYIFIGMKNNVSLV